MKKFISILLLGLCLALRPVGAEPLEFIYEHYSSFDGLSHNSISDIHQDCRGYLWLCTWYGLSRFDGINFVNYRMKPGDYSKLSHNRILSIKEDAVGNLWLRTYDYKLYRFDVENETFTAVPSELEDFQGGDFKVDHIHCDINGNTWVALSGYGLLKIDDDLSYKRYLKIDGQPVGLSISAIYEDSDGVVYVVSEMGISVVKNNGATLVSRNHDVVAFAECAGKLLFACPNTLLVVDKASGEQKSLDLSHLGVGEATAMSVTGGSDLYVGFNDNAVARLNMEDLSLKVLRSDFGRVRFLFPDSGGLLWIATQKTGIWSYNNSTGRFKHYVHSNNVKSYYADTLALVKERGGRLWIKMNNWGFGYYDREEDRIVPLSNVKEQPDARFMNGVACYEIDSSGVLWMSTMERGLEKVSVISTKVGHIVPPSESLDRNSSAEIRAMYCDSQGRLWAAAKSRELYCYSPDMTSCKRYPDSSVPDVGVIYSIMEDRQGNMWFGTKGQGLLKASPAKGGGYSWKWFKSELGENSNSLSSNNIYSMEQDADGRIWIGTYGGGISMLPTPESENFVTVANNFPNYPQEIGDRVRYLHCMPDGKMLAATVGGLIWFEPSDTPELTRFHLVQKIPGDIRSLGNNDVIYMFTDRKDNTWLCTFGGGLNRLYFEDDIPRFDVYCSDNGLSSNIVHSAIDDDNGCIWIARESGISRLDPNTGTISNFSHYDGVTSTLYSEATCARLEDGTVLFGTVDNICSINPSDFVFYHKGVRLALSGFYIDGERVPSGSGKVVIPHNYSFFRLNYASLDFLQNQRLNYSYMLEGYDKNWIQGTPDNSVTYSRIPHGHYVFKVRASYSDGVTPDEYACLKIRIKPSLWNSLPLILLYILASVTLILILIRLLFNQMKLRNDVTLEQNLSEIKGRFFTNISHELRTPLTLILGGIDEISKMTPQDAPSRYRVTMVQKNARRMMTLVNQLLDIRTIVKGKMELKISRFDVVKLVQGVYDDFRDMAKERQMEMRIIKSVDSLMVWGDSIRIEALVYNLLSNAFKYTPDGGKIEVGVLYRDGEPDFRIMVKDNGIGVLKDRQQVIFEPFSKGPENAFKGMASSGIGLSFCKEIADIHGGSIWVESYKDGGSKFFVRLPVSKERFAQGDFIVEEGSSDQTPEKGNDGLNGFRAEPSFPDGALKALVVEDNAELRIFLYNNLVNRFDVKDAPNGAEALALMDGGWIPDVIITDLMMPVMDGIELINRIRNNFNTSHIPIVLITARHEDDTHLKAMKYGADGFITKPFSIELLIAKVENLVERRRSMISRLASSAVSTEENTADKGRGVEISPEEIVITDKDEELVKKIASWLEANVADSEATVEQLALYVGMGRTSMYNKIKGLTGKSPVELIQDFRMEKATLYLKSGQFSVSETSYKVGFSDPGYFSRSFKKHFGLTPAEYIKQSRQEKENNNETNDQ